MTLCRGVEPWDGEVRELSAHDLLPRGDAAAAEALGRPPPRLQLPGAFRGGAPQRL